MSEIGVTLRIDKVGGKEAIDELNKLDALGQTIVKAAAAATGRAMNDVVAAYARGMKAGADATAALAKGYTLIERETGKTAKAAEQQAAAHDRVSRAMALQEIAAQKMNAAMDQSATSTTNATAAASGHGLQLGRLRMELGTLVGRLTGTSTAMDRMGGAIGAMALGNGIVIGALAGIAAVAGAYRFLTTDARAAAKAQGEALDAMVKWSKKRHDDATPGGEFGVQLAEGGTKLAEESKSRAGWERNRANVAGGYMVTALTGLWLDHTQKTFGAKVSAIREGNERIGEEITRGFLDHGQKEAATLAENIKSNNATHAERQRALTLLKQDTALMQQYKTGGVSGELRSTLGTTIETLQEALFPKAEKIKKAKDTTARDAERYARELASDLKDVAAQMILDAEPGETLRASFAASIFPTKAQIHEQAAELRFFVNQEVTKSIEDGIITRKKKPTLDVGDVMQQVRDGKISMLAGIDDLAHGMERAVSKSLGEALARGFETAFSNKSLGDGFKALTATLLSGLGDMMITMGASMIGFGALVEWFSTSLKALNGGNMVLAGIEMIAVGALLKSASGGIGGSIGSHMGSSGSNYGSSSGLAQIIDRGTLNPGSYTSTNAKDIPARPNLTFNLGVINPNDGGTQRVIDEINRKITQRGSLAFA